MNKKKKKKKKKKKLNKMDFSLKKLKMMISQMQKIQKTKMDYYQENIIITKSQVPHATQKTQRASSSEACHLDSGCCASI